MRVIDTQVTSVGQSRFAITTIVEIADGEESAGVENVEIGEGPLGEGISRSVPDLLVRELIDSPEPLSPAQLHDRVGGNQGTVNRQAWTLAANAPDLQQRLRGWVVSLGKGQYGLSPAARRLVDGVEPAELRGTDSHAFKELEDGVAFWRSRRSWPSDFHNSNYRRWSEENPHGTFTIEWWKPFLKQLQRWIATRPVSGEVLTQRFLSAIPDLSEEWRVSCEPFLDRDVSSVDWKDVRGFPLVVGSIKPTLLPSPVFISKFCHFLAPRIFPVVDNEALGNAWPTYESYFRFVQAEWESTAASTRKELVEALTELIESTGNELFHGFPMVNKIVELRLIGRRNPARPH